MPPPTQFGGVFLGDYDIAAVGWNSDGNEPVLFSTWADTRDVGVTTCPTNVRQLCAFGHDEDMFVGTTSLST